MTFTNRTHRKKAEKTIRRPAIIICKIVGIVCLAVVFAILALNLLKFAIYPDYYAIKTDICINPGLGDGFVCQGICEYEEGGKFFISGYMQGEKASRIYVTDTENDSYYVSLSLAGEDFKGHVGGIAAHGEEIYIVCDHAIHLLPLQRLLDAKNGDVLEIVDVIEMDNAGSSVYADDNYLYVGEFHNGAEYITYHPYDTPDGRYHAIITRYSLDDLTSPDKIYSIRDKVQGICFTPNGKICLSTSFGLTDSHYYVYDESKATDSGLTLHGAPVFYLWDVEKTISGPAMAEGIDYYNGQIITLSESASNKYIFGKFFFADKIVALDLVGD